MRSRINVTFIRDPELAGLEIGRVFRSPHAFPRHVHDYYAIGLMEEGGCYCLGPEREDSMVAPGDIALVNPGQVHSGVAPRGVAATYRMFYISKDWMRQAAMEVAGRDDGFPEFSRLVVQDRPAGRELCRLTRLLESGSDRLAKESAMVSTFSRLLERHGDLVSWEDRIGDEPRAVALVKEFLAEAPGDKVSLDELAALTGLSRYHLLRVFKRATGVSPHAFHTQLRVNQARRLLLTGLPIAEVAQETGFADQSHFSNTFRRLTGATPGQYVAGL